MRTIVSYLYLPLYGYVALVPFLVWGHLTIIRPRWKALWFLLTLVVVLAHCLLGVATPYPVAACVALVIVCSSFFFCGRYLSSNRLYSLVHILPLVCVGVLFYHNVEQAEPLSIAYSTFVYEPAIMGGISAGIMMVGFGIGKMVGFGIEKLIKRKIPSNIPFVLGAIAPLTINAFHPLIYAAYVVGAVGGWALAKEGEGSIFRKITPILRLMIYTFCFWFVSQGIFGALMTSRLYSFSMPLNIIMFALYLSAMLFYSYEVSSLVKEAVPT